MKTLNNSKINKKALLAAIVKKLGDKGASKSELQVLTARFDDLMVALKNHYATSLVTKVDHNVIVDNLAEELSKTRDFRVANFSDIKFPDFPQKMEVEMKKPDWYEAPPKSVEITGTVKAEIKDTTGDLLSGIGAMFDLLIKFLKGFTFRTTKADADYLKPQLVVLHDPYTGKALDFSDVFKMQGGGSVNISVPGGGTGSSGAIYDTLDQYKISDGDEAGTTKYYGFVDKDGNWYILKNDTTANSYRYTKGSGSYSAAWTARASKTYNTYDVIF